MEIEHFCHEHRLTLLGEDEVLDDAVRCAGCDMVVRSGAIYRCVDACNYFLHRSCAELPRKTIHIMHKKHPITLLPHPLARHSTCDACHRPFNTFAYHCYLCDFTIDLRCASLPLTVQHESHEHPFMLLPKSASFCCEACGIQSEGFSYLCTTCLLWVHPECAALPLTVKTTYHEDIIHLIHHLPGFQPCFNICRICFKTIDQDYWLYSCERHTWFAHLACATSATELEYDARQVQEKIKVKYHPHLLSLIHYLPPYMITGKCCQLCRKQVKILSNVDSRFYCCRDCEFFVHVACAISAAEDTESLDLMNEVIMKNISLGKVEVETHLQDESHQHRLDFCDVVPENEKCNGCTRLILTPYYRCSLHQCKFSLHVSCARLPKKRQHPLHEHPLVLLPESPEMGALFRCEACTNLCNGFAYGCDTSGFYLDVACSFIQDTLKHDGHEHPLLLGQETPSEQCSACGEDCVGTSYGCGDCNFRLDISCATLPRIAKHRFHRHTLSLAFSTIEDGFGEYYCDACEYPRNPNHWFYYCADCNLAAHLGCMRGEYPHIKFGGTYGRHNSCLHKSLTFVQKTKDNSICFECGDPCERLVLECSECDFKIHWMCADPPKMTLGMLNKDDEPDLRLLHVLDKDVYMMTDDAKEICLREKRSTKLKHIAHDHFLTLGFIQNRVTTCFGCKLQLAGFCYQCQKCRFYLHKKCAEAPYVLEHEVHREHPLTLTLFPLPQNKFICCYCEGTGTDFGYRCKECYYTLHIQCYFNYWEEYTIYI